MREQQTTYGFRRIDLLTGTVTTGYFNPSHSAVFTDIDSVPPRTIAKTIASLLEKWNKQQPERWAYEGLC